jgi:fructose transport system substrate-binding protein
MSFKMKATLAFAGLAFASGAALAQSQPVIGLITKTETNPFFVKMKEGAQAEAKKMGAKLMTASGKKDGDTASQITAIETMTAAGVKTILITSTGDAIIPAVKKAQEKGVQVIALDSPFEGADALYATDNYKAGILIGEYAKAQPPPKSPCLICSPATPWAPNATTAL